MVQHGGDVVVEVAFGQPPQEFILVEVIGDLAVDEVAELVGPRQIVDGEDARLTAGVERFDEIRSDESGGAGDDGVHGESLGRKSAVQADEKRRERRQNAARASERPGVQTQYMRIASPRATKLCQAQQFCIGLLKFDVDFADFGRDKRHAWSDRAQQLIPDRACGGGNVVDRQALTPEDDWAADHRLGHVGQVDGHEIHRNAAGGADFLASDEHRRPVRRMPWIPSA